MLSEYLPEKEIDINQALEMVNESRKQIKRMDTFVETMRKISSLASRKLVQHCRNNSEYSTRYFRHHCVVVSQRCTRHRLLPSPCADKNNVHCIHCYFCNAVLVVYGVFCDTSPYLHTHYLAQGEKISNDKPDTSDKGEVYEGYIPADPKKHRKLWHEQLKQVLLEDGEIDAEVQKVIGKIENMELDEAYNYIDEKYDWYGARYLYEDTAYFKGTAEEINSYLDQKMEKKPFSYYYSRKFADFTGLYMGFFAAIMFSVLFLQDTKGHTYELLHTKPIRAEKYVLGKVSAGFVTCTFVLALFNLLFWILCIVYTKEDGDWWMSFNMDSNKFDRSG